MDRAVPAFMLRGFLDELDKRGVSGSALEHASGVVLPRSTDPGPVVPELHMHKLFEAAVALTQDDTLGLAVGRAMSAASFHLIGHLALASTSLARAVELAVRASPNLQRRQLSLETLEAGRLRLGFGGGERLTTLGARVEAEMTAVLLQDVTLYFYADRTCAAPHVQFAHAAPGHRHAYRTYFPGGVSFDGDGTFVIFPSSALVRRRSGADPRLAKQIFQLAQEQYTAATCDEDWSSRVRRALRALPAPRLVDRAMLANQLGISSRGLTRRLAREGVVLSRLIDEVLYERARQLLQRPGATSTQIADELGYAELSSFFRAFRRWSGGLTPSELARRQP